MKTVVLWLIAVFALSVYPFNGNATIPNADKAFHFVIYAITCALFFNEIRLAPIRKGEKNATAFGPSIALSVTLATGYGVLMEVAQSFLTWRGFSAADIAADFAGAAATAVWFMVRRRTSA